MKPIRQWCQEITRWRERKGFRTPQSLAPGERELMLGKLMLVVSELAEAAEAVRDGDRANFAEELADTAIRLFDICGACEIDLETEIKAKMKKNESRPTRHGRGSAL